MDFLIAVGIGDKLVVLVVLCGFIEILWVLGSSEAVALLEIVGVYTKFGAFVRDFGCFQGVYSREARVYIPTWCIVDKCPDFGCFQGVYSMEPRAVLVIGRFVFFGYYLVFFPWAWNFL